MIRSPELLLGKNMPQHEQNDDMMQQISNNLMQKIADAKDECDMILALHGALKKIVFTYEPHGAKNHDELLEIMHEANLLGRPHVSEIYSPPRMSPLAERVGLKRGLALDLSVLDPYDNLPWDFTLRHKRDRARQRLR